MKCVFFGNSFTSGENNDNISFVNYINQETKNFGVSGTTMGEYSIYPTDGYSLLSLIPKYKEHIKDADAIFLQYGANDVTSIMCGFTTERAVFISFVKALDYIKQLAKPNAKIYFLATSLDYDVINLMASNMCKYLTGDYFQGFNLEIPSNLWANNYKVLMQIIGSKLEIVPMINDVNFFKECISDDNVHPNDLGHRIIADNIKLKCFM